MKPVVHSKVDYVSEFTTLWNLTDFNIKLFQVSEANSGYIVRFHVYTGKNNACISNVSNPLDEECSKLPK